MKKLSMLLSLALVLALAVPAFAGVSTDITGKVGADVRYDAQDGFTAAGDVEANIKMTAGSEGALKAVIDLGTTTASTPDAPGDQYGANPSPYVPADAHVTINIKSAYIEATGAWLKGGSDVTTKLGTLKASYNDWVADLSNDTTTQIDAVEVSGIDLGAASLTGFYGWLNPAVTGRDGTVSALSASGSLDIVDVSGVYVSETDATGANVSTDYAVEASAMPAEGVSLSAAFAGHGASSTSAYKVEGELSTMPNITVGASAWSAAAGFAPMWANHKDDDLAKETTAFTADEKGYELSASTSQSGVDLGLTYTSTTDAAGTAGSAKTVTEVTAETVVSETDLSATVTMDSSATATKIELEASRNFGDIYGSYKLVSQGATNTHTIAAETTIDTPIADGMMVGGHVVLDGATTNFGADANWKAPNGITLGLGYANYDRDDDWFDNYKDEDAWSGAYAVTDDANGADGFTITAGVEVEF